jgi:hypothetical protein
MSDYVSQVEAQIKQLREFLAPLESGKRRIGSRTDDGPWKDITEQAITRNKRIIATYQEILEVLKDRQIPAGEIEEAPAKTANRAETSNRAKGDLRGGK